MMKEWVISFFYQWFLGDLLWERVKIGFFSSSSNEKGLQLLMGHGEASLETKERSSQRVIPREVRYKDILSLPWPMSVIPVVTMGPSWRTLTVYRGQGLSCS